MDQAPQSKFEGWAIAELFGHQREVGFVTTEYFGPAALFRIDVPELLEREFVLKRPAMVDERWTAAGAKVKRQAVPARSRLIGPGAIYALNPCSEEAAKAAIEELSPRPLILIEAPKIDYKVLPQTVPDDDDFNAEGSDG